MPALCYYQGKHLIYKTIKGWSPAPSMVNRLVNLLNSFTRTTKRANVATSAARFRLRKPSYERNTASRWEENELSARAVVKEAGAQEEPDDLDKLLEDEKEITNLNTTQRWLVMKCRALKILQPPSDWRWRRNIKIWSRSTTISCYSCAATIGPMSWRPQSRASPAVPLSIWFRQDTKATKLTSTSRGSC